MIAMFDGVCAICIDDINEGEHEIKYCAEEEGWVHEECLEELEDAQIQDNGGFASA